MSAPSRVIIGLDVGTSGVKAVAFGVGTPWRSAATRHYPLLTPAPDRVEQDPATVLDAVGAALAECTERTNGADVAAVSLSAAMHSLVALDAQRQPITPLITWADTRARAEAHELSALAGGRFGRHLHRTTGTPLHPMTPLAKLQWFSRHDRDVWSEARWWVGLKDLVIDWLTGTLTTERSSASGTGLVDLASGNWSPAALDACGVSPDRLPPVASTIDVLNLAPTPAARVGLPAGTPVVTGAADGPLANLGCGALDPSVVALSLGTSAAVRRTVSEPSVGDDDARFCYALTDTMWVTGYALSNGGEVARWGAEALAPDLAGGDGRTDSGANALLELAAQAPPGSDGLVMVPFLLPERAPFADPDLAGTYLGMRRTHTRAHLARAAIEGVAMQVRFLLDRLDPGAHVSDVRATGGSLRSALWREVMAAMAGRPLRVNDDAEGSALGAAALGLLAIGGAPDLDGALALLGGPDGTEAAPISVDHEVVATYDRLRASIPQRIDALARTRW